MTSLRARRGWVLSVALSLVVWPLGLVGQPIQAAATPVAPATAARADTLFPSVGHRGYDVLHYDIALTYLVGGGIRAKTTITARANRPLTSFALDLEGLTVSRVRVNGQPATYRRAGTKLTVTPARRVKGTFTTTVSYSGVPVTHIDPDGSQDGWVATPDGATALNEPVGAMTWFPNNNTPRDKATFRFQVTVPAALEVAANGVLEHRRTRGTETTWTWRQRRPMATYLSLLSIGNYDVYYSTIKLRSGRQLPVWSFIDPALGTLAADRAKLPEIIRFEERRYGRYPFDSAGIVVKKTGVGYALETQDRPFFDGPPDESTLVHEFAHQWYGDSVTPRDWGDIWLNEGFATYTEWAWTAAHGGKTTAAEFQEIYDDNPASAELWSPAPARLSDPADLFAEPVYTRGALTLEALRQEVGDRAFNTILRRWATERRGQSVKTAQFIALAERVSDRDLDAFFQTWLYTAKKPAGY